MKAARSVRRCPECRAVAPKRLRTTLRWRGLAFCECPKCGIGSPRWQWNDSYQPTPGGAASKQKESSNEN